jgi:hypothetical protein
LDVDNVKEDNNDDDIITKENSLTGKNLLIQICMDTGFDPFGNQYFDTIYVTDRIDKCKTPLDQYKFGFIVQDFSLPEEVGTGLGNSVKRFVGAYGDPKYMVYYEKFPEGEDEAWAGYSLLNLGKLGTEVIPELVGIVLKRIPLIGPAASAVAKPVLRAIVNLAIQSYDLFKDKSLAEAAIQIEDLLKREVVTISQMMRLQDVKVTPEYVQTYLAVKYGGKVH